MKNEHFLDSGEEAEHGQEKLSILLKTIRRAHRLSTRELSEKSGVSHSYIALLEGGGKDPRTGKKINPHPDTLKLIGNSLSGSYLILMDAAGYLPKNYVLEEENLFTDPDLTTIKERVETELGQDILSLLGRKTTS